MYIYKLSSPEGKVYIGLTTKTMGDRWKAHRQNWERRQIKFNRLYREFDRFHPDLWKRELVCRAKSLEELSQLEKIFIQQYQSDREEFGFNEGAGGGRGAGLRPGTGDFVAMEKGVRSMEIYAPDF